MFTMRKTAIAARVALMVAAAGGMSSAMATNGYFPIGYGMKALGMGGASVASTDNGFAGANNPAAAAWSGTRIDAGASIFMPKRGYSRVAQVNAQNVRKGRLEPELVAASNDEHDGVKPASLEVFLEYMGLTEEEFNTIVTSMSVSPYEHDFSAMKDGGALWDMDLWAREDNR